MITESVSSEEDHRFDSGEAAYVLKDEHTTIGCLISAVIGERMTLTTPDAERVPSVFVLYAPHLKQTVVCWTVWRSAETITAAFHSPVGGDIDTQPPRLREIEYGRYNVRVSLQAKIAATEESEAGSTHSPSGG